MVIQGVYWKINVRNLIVFDRIYEICMFCPPKGLLRRNTNEIPYSRNLREGLCLQLYTYVLITSLSKHRHF